MAGSSRLSGRALLVLLLFSLKASAAAPPPTTEQTPIESVETTSPSATEPRGSAADAPVESAADARTRHGSAFVDPLGFALFGPRLGIELASGHFGFGLQARWFNAGLLAHKMFLGDGDDLAFSYGAGARGRYYFGERQSSLHFGLGAEYLHTRVENQSALVATMSAYLVPYVEGGYRIPLGAFFADASAGFGYAARLSSSVGNLRDGSSAELYEASNESSIYGTASLELGVFF